MRHQRRRRSEQGPKASSAKLLVLPLLLERVDLLEAVLPLAVPGALRL